jgi:hypothetical protein
MFFGFLVFWFLKRNPFAPRTAYAHYSTQIRLCASERFNERDSG